MKCKAGVEITKNGLTPALNLLRAMVVADKVCAMFGIEPIVTSIFDGTHMAGSLHYLGRAFDLRSRDLVPSQRSAFRAALARELGPDFDVVLESSHVHVEWDPKTTHIAMQQGA